VYLLGQIGHPPKNFDGQKLLFLASVGVSLRWFVVEVRLKHSHPTRSVVVGAPGLKRPHLGRSGFDSRRVYLHPTKFSLTQTKVNKDKLLKEKVPACLDKAQTIKIGRSKVHKVHKVEIWAH